MSKSHCQTLTKKETSAKSEHIGPVKRKKENVQNTNAEIYQMHILQSLLAGYAFRIDGDSTLFPKAKTLNSPNSLFHFASYIFSTILSNIRFHSLCLLCFLQYIIFLWCDTLKYTGWWWFIICLKLTNRR